MAYVRGLGLFDMANDPTCGLFQFGIFNPRCWAEAANGPIIPGQSVNTDDSSFKTPPAPIPPILQPDLSGQSVDIDKQIADTAAANKAQALQFFRDQEAASKAAGPKVDGLSNQMLILIGVAVFGFAFLVGGRR